MGTKSRNSDPESAIAFRWEFLPRFRRGAFGWRGSALACQRVRQAVAEIRMVARKNPVLAGEGAVRFLERISGALEQIDSSSGTIGNAVYGAILDLVPIVSSAPVEEKVRNAWMDRLWKAHEDDRIPYIESLTDHWGELCASGGIASKWADESLPFVKMVFGPCRLELPGGRLWRPRRVLPPRFEFFATVSTNQRSNEMRCSAEGPGNPGFFVSAVRGGSIEHQLAHSVRDPLGRAYNRTSHLSERRKMMQVWADYLDGLKQGAKVVPIKRAPQEIG